MKQTTAHQRLGRLRHVKPQHGIGVVVALLVLVVLSSLAAAMVRLNWGQQIASAQDYQGSQASLAASAGVDWGLFQVLRTGGSWVGCTSSSQTLDLRSTMGFWVTVTCSSRATAFVESAKADGSTPRSVRVYKIDAVACNGTATCPDNARAAMPTYIERQRQVTATDINTNQDN
jgi:MSHA biogenesis protein MshP